jgi:hypothetical protein
MEGFQLVSAGRVTLAVGTPCLRNRVTLVEGTTFVHVSSLPWFASASRGNFLDLRMLSKNFLLNVQHKRSKNEVFRTKNGVFTALLDCEQSLYFPSFYCFPD